MVIYSHSRLSTFEKCPLKFKFQYIDRLEPEIKQTIEGFLGNKVHEVLEWVYCEVMEGRIHELDEIIRLYAEIWNRDYSKEIKVINEDLNADHYFNKGVKFLIDYFVHNYPFSDNTIAIEKKIIFNLDEDGKYKMQGYIDRLVRNLNTHAYEIHDYKTGAMKSQQDLDTDRQLALYSLGIKQEFKDASEVHLVWHFLDLNRKMISRRTDEQLESLKKDIIQLIDKIESTTEFEANPSPLCRWCEFQGACEKCKNQPLTENESVDNRIDE